VSQPVHGGPDGLQPITCDFSTNANPLAPPRAIVRALAEADRARYPDPSYAALRAALGAWHGVPPPHVLPTAGTSEAIRRLTLAASLQGVARVWVPRPGYGDYAAAAQALQMRVDHYDTAEDLLRVLQARSQPALAWICEPCNPTGDSLPPDFWREAGRHVESFKGLIALDRAYEALRLVGSDPVPASFATRTWQCLSPNKSLGLTGIRAGYLLAPVDGASGLRAQVETLAASWVLSAEGVALLGALHQPATQSWLSDSRATLANWEGLQRHALARLGWRQRSSVVPFWLARPCAGPDSQGLSRRLRQLRDRGIKLRDATSFGMPGWVRVSVQAPASQQALIEAWDAAR
jgi:histidinol-phosphate aminotransferase